MERSQPHKWQAGEYARTACRVPLDDTRPTKLFRAFAHRHEPSPSPDSGASAYLDSPRSRISTVGAIVSILAPSIYAAVAKSPVVTSYFDLLNQLARAA